jgi:hypothetical protein
LVSYYPGLRELTAIRHAAGTFRQHPDHASTGSEPSSAARGTSKLSSRAVPLVLELQQGTGRDCAHKWGASVKRPARCQQAVTAGHPAKKPEPAHLPAIRCPGHLADADQHGTDEAWPACAAQVISMPATLRPSGTAGRHLLCSPLLRFTKARFNAQKPACSPFPSGAGLSIQPFTRSQRLPGLRGHH